MMKLRSLAVTTVVIFQLAGCAADPSTEKVTEALKPIMPTDFAVNSVAKLSALNGVYEVVVTINKQPTVLYIDRKLTHVISGSVMEIASKKNLTYEAQQKIKPAGTPAAVQSPSAPAPAQTGR